MGSESLTERLRPDSASMQERGAGNSHQGKGLATKNTRKTRSQENVSHSIMNVSL